MAKEILLTKGKSAIVSDEDYEWVLQRRWRVNGKDGNQYAVTGRPQRKSPYMAMHQAIVDRMGLNRSGLVVDHINGNALDNRRENLRVCTQVENVRNKRRDLNSHSLFRGVSWHKHNQCWQVSLAIEVGKVKNFGFYESPVIAAVFANDVIRNRDGAFARLNEIPPHVELLARQVPHRPKWSRNPQLKLAQLEHAERVEKAYSEWQAQHPARPSVTANGVNESTEAA